MNDKIKQIIETLVPFLILGVMAALFIGLIIMFSSVLIWGIFIGGILWAISMLKGFFFPEKKVPKSEGRIIEHDDQK